MKVKTGIIYLMFLACMSCTPGLSQKPGPDGLVPYAPVKASARQIMAKSAVAGTCHTRFPARGVVVSYGSFLTRDAEFYIVDLGRRVIRKIKIGSPTQIEGQQPRMDQVVWFDGSADLSPDELNPLIIKMNHVWQVGASTRAERQSPDSTSSLLLLDRDLAFSDSGTFTHAPDKVLMAAVDTLAQKHKLTRAFGAPTDLPCDPPQMP